MTLWHSWYIYKLIISFFIQIFIMNIMNKYNNIMWSLYLVSLFNSDYCIQQVHFIEDMIEVKYVNNSLKQFFFSTLDINYNKLSKKLDNMLEVNGNSSEGDEVLKMMNFLFFPISIFFFFFFNTSCDNFFYLIIVQTSESMQFIQGKYFQHKLNSACVKII